MKDKTNEELLKIEHSTPDESEYADCIKEIIKRFKRLEQQLKDKDKQLEKIKYLDRDNVYLIFDDLYRKCNPSSMDIITAINKICNLAIPNQPKLNRQEVEKIFNDNESVEYNGSGEAYDYFYKDECITAICNLTVKEIDGVNSFENKYVSQPISCPFCEFGVPDMPIPDSLKQLKKEHDLYHKK
jgi:hypothetical protein